MPIELLKILVAAILAAAIAPLAVRADDATGRRHRNDRAGPPRGRGTRRRPPDPPGAARLAAGPPGPGRGAGAVLARAGAAGNRPASRQPGGAGAKDARAERRGRDPRPLAGRDLPLRSTALRTRTGVAPDRDRGPPPRRNRRRPARPDRAILQDDRDRAGGVRAADLARLPDRRGVSAAGPARRRAVAAERRRGTPVDGGGRAGAGNRASSRRGWRSGRGWANCTGPFSAGSAISCCWNAASSPRPPCGWPGAGSSGIGTSC